MNPPDGKPSARAWLIVVLLGGAACLNYLDRVMITTMRGSIKEAIPMSDTQFGLLTSVFLWVYAFLSPFAGFMADRFGRARVIVISLFIWSAITWLTAHAQTFNELLATRALMGISEACYLPAALALIADYHPGRSRGLATGLHMCGVLVGNSLGGLSGWLAEKHTWNYSFSLFGIIGVAYSLMLIGVLRDRPPSAADPAAPREIGPKVKFGAAIASLFSERSFIVLFFFYGLLGVAGWAAAGWMPTFLGERYHLAQGMAAIYATTYLQPGSLVGMLVGGSLADRWSRKLARGRIYVPMIGLCIAAPCILFAVHAPFLGLTIAALLLQRVVGAFTDANLMPILCLVTDPRYRATGYGILNFFACMVGGLTIYLGGVLRDAQIPVIHIFEAASVGLITCATLLYFVKPIAAARPTE